MILVSQALHWLAKCIHWDVVAGFDHCVIVHCQDTKLWLKLIAVIAAIAPDHTVCKLTIRPPGSYVAALTWAPLVLRAVAGSNAKPGLTFKPNLLGNIMNGKWLMGFAIEYDWLLLNPTTNTVIAFLLLSDTKVAFTSSNALKLLNLLLSALLKRHHQS